MENPKILISEEAYNYFKKEFEGKPKADPGFTLGLMAEIQLQHILGLPYSQYIPDWQEGDGGVDLTIPYIGTVDVKAIRSLPFSNPKWTVHERKNQSQYIIFVKLSPIFEADRLPDWADLSESDKIMEVCGFLPTGMVVNPSNFHPKGEFDSDFKKPLDNDVYFVTQQYLDFQKLPIIIPYKEEH